MRRRTICVVAALAVVLRLLPLQAQSPAAAGVVAPLDNSLQLIDLFRDYLEALRVQAGIPGLSAAIVGRSDIVWERGFGQASVNEAVPARPDTLYPIDGLVQPLTASLVLRCVEDGRLLLENTLGKFSPDSREPATTIQQVLAQTVTAEGAVTFLLRPTRYDVLGDPLLACSRKPLRETYVDLLERLGMVDSLPGLDAAAALAASGSAPSADQAAEKAARLERYTNLRERLATLYTVDSQRRPTESQYSIGTLSPSTGLVSTVRDLAKFDLALRGGLLLRPDTMAAGWKAQVGSDNKPLPFGLGWFVQSYRGELVVWQFGVSETSSSMIATLPNRGVTMILLANSSGIVKGFPLAAGDLAASPFGRVFLGFFVR